MQGTTCLTSTASVPLGPLLMFSVTIKIKMTNCCVDVTSMIYQRVFVFSGWSLWLNLRWYRCVVRGSIPVAHGRSRRQPRQSDRQDVGGVTHPLRDRPPSFHRQLGPSLRILIRTVYLYVPAAVQDVYGETLRHCYTGPNKRSKRCLSDMRVRYSSVVILC